MNRILDALALAGVIVTAPFSRRSVRARGGEWQRALPGDEMLPDANDRWTQAITLRAPPAAIWPWLVQMGCRRAGWYSYDALDNGGTRSAERIVPDLQRAAVGDVFPWTPTSSDGFIVRALEPPRYLILGGDAGSRYRVIWAFVLEPIDGGRTRLLVRCSGSYTHVLDGIYLRFIARAIHFGMQRRQLLNLLRRTEAAQIPLRLETAAPVDQAVAAGA